MSTVGSIANAPPAGAVPAAEANAPDAQSFQASAQAAAQQKAATQMMGAVGQTIMMPLIFQAMNAGQDDG